jgi:hypothetical protein
VEYYDACRYGSGILTFLTCRSLTRSSLTMNAHQLSPFFYYNPEASAESRQTGVFMPHPGHILPSSQVQRFQQTFYPQEMMMQQQQQQIRPSSSGSPMYIPPAAMSLQSNMTPVASPRPIHQKPTLVFQEGHQLMLNTEMLAHDGYFYPATPPLSTSGSTISSPPMSCGTLPTPTGPVFSPSFNIEGVKQGCEKEVKSEILAGGDWARCGSPPLTPGKLLSPFRCC